MSNKIKATAKDAEGKLESAYGDLTGDTGHKIKGEAKQMQAKAMHASENLKQDTKDAKKKLSDAVDQVADDLS